jgi:hypothetical protein
MSGRWKPVERNAAATPVTVQHSLRARRAARDFFRLLSTSKSRKKAGAGSGCGRRCDDGGSVFATEAGESSLRRRREERERDAPAGDGSTDFDDPRD